MKFRILLVLAAFAAGCAAEQDTPDLATQSQRMIGGIDDSTPGVVETRHPPGASCTGTVVGERVILTAAHCIEEPFEAGNHSGRVYFGDGGASGFFDDVRVTRLAPHRYFEMGSIRTYDIGLMRLIDPIPGGVPIHPFNLDPLDDIVGEHNSLADIQGDLGAPVVE